LFSLPQAVRPAGCENKPQCGCRRDDDSPNHGVDCGLREEESGGGFR
jgi:hypothetical protein